MESNQLPTPVFRGLIAPASLKRLLGGGLGGLVSSFPGLDCPGLIEAKCFKVKIPEDGDVFRGLIAPASLKPSNICSKRSTWIVFRGLIAPASLKRI